MKLRTLLFFLVATLILQGCSVTNKVATDGFFQKRKYRKGWHIGPGGNNDNVISHKMVKPIPAKEPSMSGPTPPRILGNIPIVEEQECDVITKRDGQEIKAKVKEVGTDFIKYKKCDRPDGPLYNIKKSEVFMIKYPGGGKDVFQEDNSPKKTPQENEKKASSQQKEDEEKKEGKNNAWDVLGFISSLISAILMFVGAFIAVDALLVSAGIAILAIIFSAIGNGGLGDAGLVISIITLVLDLIMIVVLIALLAV